MNDERDIDIDDLDRVDPSSLPPPEDPDASIPHDDELRAVQSQCTDAANADAVLAAYPLDTFRYVTEWEQWISWDGKRWALGGGKSGSRDAVVQAAIRVARLRFFGTLVQVRELETQLATTVEPLTKDKLERAIKFKAKLLAWFEKSQNANRANACVSLLQGLLGVSMSALDRNPWLFNVRNGTLDLRTGELRDHDRSDLLTQLADHEYDPRAKCPTWTAFLSTAMGGKTPLVLYLQRVVGYQMTALIKEQCLTFHYGEGSNGKSTFRSTVQALLGEYAAAAPRGLLLATKGPPAHPTELARLYGKRFAACGETGENDQWDEAKVKDLTGGDVIPCRRMSENFWDLWPTHKLDGFGNHRPNISGTDLGIWRRIKLIPWVVTIADADKDADLPSKLKAELSGILNWAIAGCLEWQRIGLSEPEEVTQAVGAYRSESDVLGAFLRDHCVFEPGARVARRVLRKRYETWCEELGHRAVGAKKLSERRRRLTVEDLQVKLEGKTVDGWRGVRLKVDDEGELYRGTVSEGVPAWS